MKEISKEIIDFINRVYERQALIITDKERDSWIAWLDKDSADIVEPKFHVRDWVVTDKGYTIQIGAVNPGYYTLNNGMEFCMSYVDKYWKLWTIQDAKPGDVLVDRFSKDNTIILYQGINPNRSILAYCGWNGYSLSIKTDGLGYGNLDNTNYVPANKEQCDFLFAKLKEAGYQWYSEFNQLRKLDEEYNGEEYGIDSLYHAQRILEKTLGKVDGYQSDDGILEHKCAITAVKKLYEHKSAKWSREDEKILNSLISSLARISALTRTDSTSINYTFSKEIDWLKSLKERYTWKPSDEQRRAICLAAGYIYNLHPEITKILKDMLNELEFV